MNFCTVVSVRTHLTKWTWTNHVGQVIGLLALSLLTLNLIILMTSGTNWVFKLNSVICILHLKVVKTIHSSVQLNTPVSLHLDDSYSTFYTSDDYPIIKYLQQPLYFEVELTRSSNPQLSLELENCWATLNEDRTTQPRWNLLING